MPGRMRDPGPSVNVAGLGEPLGDHGAPHGRVPGGFDDWTVDDLRRLAAELGIQGRSRMRKDDLIEALRSHRTGG